MARATISKEGGNAAFTHRPPDLPLATRSYRAALDILPEVPPKKQLSEKASGKAPDRSGIQEITEDEAAEIEQQASVGEDPERRALEAREHVEDEVRQLQKACWGNLAACHIALVSCLCPPRSLLMLVE